MKFIFPQNYDFRSKFLGIFDYSTLIFNSIYALFLFCLLDLLFHSLELKVFLFILFYFPILLFSIIGFNHENILYVLYYILQYYKNPKLYLYQK